MTQRSTLGIAICALCFFGTSLRSLAQVGSITRSDSIDILHTRVDLDLTQINSDLLIGHAMVRFTPKVSGIDHLPMDLMVLSMDSVTFQGQSLAYTYADEVVNIALGQTFNVGDTLELTVHYHGDPATDPGGFGGFYTETAIQYAIGIALYDQPHSYGRSWFPCFDNFVERCSFEFIVHTSLGRKSFASGTLISETNLGGGSFDTHWFMDEQTPSYLASVSSGNYQALRDTFPSISGALIPVTLCALPADTADMLATFIHLHDIFDQQEAFFGPYLWDRVGFSLTTVGAMEHATNISFPASTVDGTVTDEPRISHELAHHWFGNLMTCERAEMMYLNEGFAEFSSYLYIDQAYGRAAYLNTVRSNHKDMLVTAHIRDDGWYALDSIPLDKVYGVHAYYKGADFIRSLRGYMGDSLFSIGLKSVLADRAFNSVNSAQLRDGLASATGIELNDFFDDWIFQPGWAAFEVDSMTVAPSGGLFPTTVHVQQKLRHADHFYHNVPVTLTFEDAQGSRWSDPEPAMLGGEFTTFNSTPPFYPVFAFLNADEQLALATSVQEDTLVNIQTISFPLADVALVVNTMPSPSPLRVEEFWTAADDNTAEPFAFQVSPDRWWRITGQLAVGSNVGLRITIDGRPTSSSLTDPGLVQNSGGVAFVEDSLVVLYRPNAYFPWTEDPDIDINFLGSDHTNGNARLTVNSISLGDYCVAWRKSATGLGELNNALKEWLFYPNPASDRVVVEAPQRAKSLNASIRLHDAQGRLLIEQPVTSNRTQIELKGIAEQTIFVSVAMSGAGSVSLGPLVIRK